MTTLTLPFPPSTNNLYATVRGRRVLSREGRAFKERAAVIALTSGMKPIDGPICVVVEVFRPRRAGDLDNSLKAVLDSLRGIAWKDDSQISEIVARRFEDKEQPRVQITVARVAA